MGPGLVFDPGPKVGWEVDTWPATAFHCIQAALSRVRRSIYENVHCKTLVLDQSCHEQLRKSKWTTSWISCNVRYPTSVCNMVWDEASLNWNLHTCELLSCQRGDGNSTAQAGDLNYRSG
eukprot:6482116-Amphidinium_carterae.5